MTEMTWKIAGKMGRLNGENDINTPRSHGDLSARLVGHPEEGDTLDPLLQ